MRKYTNNDTTCSMPNINCLLYGRVRVWTKWVKNGDGGVNRQFREWTYPIAPNNKWKDLHPKAIIEF